MRGTLVMLGGALAVLALVHARRFARLDRTMPAPGEEAELLRKLAMFAPLPLAVIELLATELTPHEFAPGTVVVREGEPGDQFHVIVDGSALVSVRGQPRPPLARGDPLGEIALFRNVPRTATIVAAEPLRTLSLDQEMFLFAITGNSDSSAAADTLVAKAALRGPGCRTRAAMRRSWRTSCCCRAWTLTLWRWGYSPSCSPILRGPRRCCSAWAGTSTPGFCLTITG